MGNCAGTAAQGAEIPREEDAVTTRLLHSNLHVDLTLFAFGGQAHFAKLTTVLKK